MKEMREQQDETMAGQRGSRIAKWIQSSAELRQKAGLSSPEKLKNFGIVRPGFECFGCILMMVLHVLHDSWMDLSWFHKVFEKAFYRPAFGCIWIISKQYMLTYVHYFHMGYFQSIPICL